MTTVHILRKTPRKLASEVLLLNIMHIVVQNIAAMQIVGLVKIMVHSKQYTLIHMCTASHLATITVINPMQHCKHH